MSLCSQFALLLSHPLSLKIFPLLLPIDASLQTNDETLVGMGFYFLLVSHREEMESNDYAVDVIRDEIFEDRGAHYCLFLKL